MMAIMKFKSCLITVRLVVVCSKTFANDSSVVNAYSSLRNVTDFWDTNTYTRTIIKTTKLYAMRYKAMSGSWPHLEDDISPLSNIDPSIISHNVSKVLDTEEKSSFSLANCATPSAKKPKYKTENRIMKCQRSPAAWVIVLIKIAVRGWTAVWKISRKRAAVAWKK